MINDTETVREQTPTYLIMPKLKMAPVSVAIQEPYTELMMHFTPYEIDIIVKQTVVHLTDALIVTGAENQTTEHLRAILRGAKEVQRRRHL